MSDKDEQIQTAIDKILDLQLDISPEQIYVTGLSMGLQAAIATLHNPHSDAAPPEPGEISAFVESFAYDLVSRAKAHLSPRQRRQNPDVSTDQ